LKKKGLEGVEGVEGVDGTTIKFGVLAPFRACPELAEGGLGVDYTGRV
jgi:hypothetical protein